MWKMPNRLTIGDREDVILPSELPRQLAGVIFDRWNLIAPQSLGNRLAIGDQKMLNRP